MCALCIIPSFSAVDPSRLLQTVCASYRYQYRAVLRYTTCGIHRNVPYYDIVGTAVAKMSFLLKGSGPKTDEKDLEFILQPSSWTDSPGCFFINPSKSISVRLKAWYDTVVQYLTWFVRAFCCLLWQFRILSSPK